MTLHRRTALFIMAILAVFASVFPVSAENLADSGKPRIVVFGFINLTGDSSFSIPTETATENLVFTLKLLPKYEAIETDLILRHLSDETLAKYCLLNRLDFILYGSLDEDSEGRQKYTLSLFDREKGETTVHESDTGDSVLEVFTVTDRLSASVLGTILGRRLTFGSIEIKNIGKPAEFDVFIDSVPVKSGEGIIDHIPDGPHTVHVVRTDAVPWGTLATLDYDVTVTEDGITPVSLEFEPILDTESETFTYDDSQDDEELEEEYKLRTGFAVSAYGFADAMFGKFGDVLDNAVGYGGSLEYSWSRVGLSLRGQWAMGIPADDGVTDEGVSDYQALAAFGGLFIRIPESYGSTEVRLELAGGLWRHELTFEGDTDWSGTQMDPAIQVSLALRIHSHFIGFEIAPYAMVLPEKKEFLFMGGVRAGLVVGGRQ